MSASTIYTGATVAEQPTQLSGFYFHEGKASDARMPYPGTHFLKFGRIYVQEPHDAV
jgi:hypothetical protein